MQKKYVRIEIYRMIINLTPESREPIDLVQLGSLCDLLNQNLELSPVFAMMIQQRLELEMKNYQTQFKTLCVLESLIKNCGRTFHKAIGNKKFVALIKKLGGKMVRGQEPPEHRTLLQSRKDTLQKKVIHLIQFLGVHPSVELVLFSKLFNELKAKGVRFPPLTKEDFVSLNGSKAPTWSISTESLFIPYYFKQKLTEIKETIIVFESLLESNESSEPDDLMIQTRENCQKKKTQLLNLIEEHTTGGDEALMNTLFQLHDRAERCLEKYHSLFSLAQLPQEQAENSSRSSSSPMQEKKDDDEVVYIPNSFPPTEENAFFKWLEQMGKNKQVQSM